ncbi:MucR family transcriptional regulator [Labrys monachus]|uniref:Transcriptional regulator n=1 Tax=Labrys monachus TaxID=217067 RepID=A0ABU0FEN0_9HYPH|nr:MucR family transcriptional regulator [Labrys monachus]MDQ0392594.1 putative transcriptional regulator [Labrys monachus]
MDDVDIGITADIVSAYVSNNSVALADLPKVIADVHAALIRLAKGEELDEPADSKLTPAVPIKKSITPDYIISLEDGQKYKSLKRHLKSQYGITPDEYRAKWGLPPDYPMVAPNYAKSRSELAKQMGLGQKRKKILPKKLGGTT